MSNGIPTFAPIAERVWVMPEKGESKIFFNMPDEVYNSKDPEILKFWRSSQFCDTRDYSEFCAALEVEREAFDEATLKAFAIGHYFEDLAAGDTSKYFVLDESARPLPDTDFRNSTNKNWKNEILNQCDARGFTVVPYSEIAFLDKMVKNAEYLELHALLPKMDKHVAIFWWESVKLESKTVWIPLRVQLDFSKVDKDGFCSIIDYKTTKDTRRKWCSYSVYDRNYLHQATMQARAVLASGYGKKVGYSWAVQSKAYPYEFFIAQFDSLESRFSNYETFLNNLARYLTEGAPQTLTIEKI